MSTTAAKTNETVKSRMSTRDIVLIGMFAALLAAFSQISLPMPTGVPITIQAFGVALVGVVLGWKRALFSTIVYILLGAVGLPVFANFQGGLRVITGLTGGYILAWPVMAALCGASIPVKSASAPVSLFFLHRTVRNRHAGHGGRRGASVGPAGGRQVLRHDHGLLLHRLHPQGHGINHRRGNRRAADPPDAGEGRVYLTGDLQAGGFSLLLWHITKKAGVGPGGIKPPDSHRLFASF